MYDYLCRMLANISILAGKLIPAIGSGDLVNVSKIIIRSLNIFLIQK